MKHYISSQEISRQEVEKIFKEATRLEKEEDEGAGDNSMKGKIMASLFYEPSTRTRFSLESAMLRLGGSVITSENAKEFSSASKGETLEDSTMVMNNYADVIVMRHFEKGASAKAASVATIPIINAGDGAGEHPTQALLDVYTIEREIGYVDNISIAMIGDLKNGRTVRSLCYLLAKFENIKIIFVSPTELKIGDDIKDFLDANKVTHTETEDLEKAIDQVDVVYQTRIQKERFATAADYEKYKGVYILTSTHVDLMREKAIIMHPLPRVDEIATEVDSSPKAAYFRQAKYGVLVRMALLKYVTDNI